LLNWLRAKGELSSAAVEDFNYKIRVVTRRSYGFRAYKAMKMGLFHTFGRLPEPESTHHFYWASSCFGARRENHGSA
jgi:hypothetical protein